MEDSFAVRVAKTFGSLSSTTTSNSAEPLGSSLWSLTDEEIEKKEWKRDTETPDDADAEAASFPSVVDGFFANRNLDAGEKQLGDFGVKEPEDDLQGLDGEEDESGVIGRRNRVPGRGGRQGEDENEEWEIKDSIGMDCTLDFEAEEDEYDKVAVGDEERGDRVYMHDVNDFGIHINSHNELPTSIRKASKDPRANRLAAMLRLKEDADTAQNLHSPIVPSETAMSAEDNRSSAADESIHHKPGSEETTMVGVQEKQVNGSESGIQVKPILKRKEQQRGSSAKRVRFVPGCKEEDKEDVHMEIQRDSPLVPDYLRNPSKYTLYTFDETNDLDERSNSQGYMSFLNDLRKSKQLEPDEPPADLSQPVLFTPKRKAKEASLADDESKTEQKDATLDDSMRKRSAPISIADEDAQEYDVCDMEEDSPQIEACKKKTSRQYRSKVNESLD